MISTDKAPAAIGPYSQAMRVGDFLFLSGQLGVNPVTGEFAGSDAAAQIRQALTNMQAVLESAGATIADVVKTTIFLADMNDFKTVNEIYGSFFRIPYPARSTVEVSRLPKNAMVEVEAIAHT